MKRLIMILLSIMFVFVFAFNSFAANIKNTKNNVSAVVEYYDDGSYLTTVIVESTTRAANTKSGTKTVTYTGSDDEIKWEASVHGTFSYTGTSATCTASSVSYNSYDSNWIITSAIASRSGATARADVVVQRVVLGVTVKTVNSPMTLTCSPTGVLS